MKYKKRKLLLKIKHIVSKYFHVSEIVYIKHLNIGNINSTFYVQFSEKNGQQQEIIMQKINSYVFKDPIKMNKSLESFLNYFSSQNIINKNIFIDRRWEMLKLHKTIDTNEILYQDNLDYWRATSFIKSSFTVNTIDNIIRANEVGFALGIFHSFSREFDLKNNQFDFTDLHDTNKYLNKYFIINYKVDSRAKASSYINSKIQYVIRNIEQRSNLIEFYDHIKCTNQLKINIIHGDPKVNNILFDLFTEKSISIVDLDTLSLGYFQFDIADCLRSICNKLGEDTFKYDSVEFDLNFYSSMLKGYRKASLGFISNNELLFIPYFLKVLTYELGIRFFLDYLEGNIYFKTEFYYQNLYRSVVQFKLLNSIEAKWDKILFIADDLLRTK